MTTEQMFRVICAVDRDAGVVFSDCTRKFYVRAACDIGGDGFLRGFVEHSDTIEGAVRRYFERMIAVAAPLHIHHRNTLGRERRVRWNGFMWADVYVGEPEPVAPAPRPGGAGGGGDHA